MGDEVIFLIFVVSVVILVVISCYFTNLKSSSLEKTLSTILATSSSTSSTSSTSTSTSSMPINQVIMTLVRQAARWTIAAEQDSNVLVSVLHANYGAGYLWALKDIASDCEIESVANIDMKKFTAYITKVQDDATKKMADICPKYAPKSTYLTKIASE